MSSHAESASLTVAEHYGHDHARLDDLLEQFKQLHGADLVVAHPIFAEFKAGLERHIRWKEEILFPIFEGKTEMRDGGPTALMWISASRDKCVFEKPEEFRLDRDPGKNLLYGAGIHVCPGAPLARLELRVFMEELLSRTGEIAIVPEKAATFAVYPASGFATLPLKIK